MKFQNITSEVYDTFTKTVIKAESREKLAGIIRIPQSMVCNLLNSKIKTLMRRYVRNDGVVRWITLVDFETGQEYDCLSYLSLALQIGEGHSNRKDSAAFGYLKKSGYIKGGAATIFGRIFYKKGNYPTFFTGKVKNPGPKFTAILDLQKRRKYIGNILRNRIRDVMQNAKTSKKGRAWELLGCRPDFFMGWIESQFTEGMSWNNWGKWHVDHIKPINTFNLLEFEEQKKCFHYTNCRPLWAEENMKRPKDGSDIV